MVPPVVGAPARVPLDRIPMPPYVIVLLAVTLLCFVAGLAKIPGSMSSAIRFEHGSKNLAKGDVNGVDDMEAVFTKLDDPSVDIKLRMAEAYVTAHRPQQAAKIINKMSGEKLDKDEMARAKAVAEAVGVVTD